jgi:DNA invertase Pin-like site-specific DNA recombinase
MKSAIGYIRVSSAEQADSGLGLEAQRQRINAFCVMKGLTLVEVFEDAAVSGGKPLGCRPAGSRLLAEAKKSKAVVIVAKLDRLFRSVADASAVIADFDRKGIELIAIAENFDMTNPFGRAMAQMCSIFAELERSMIRERTKSAMNVKRTRGQRIGKVPYGHVLAEDGKTLVRVQSEQDTIVLIHQWKGEGRTLREIARELTNRGIPTKEGNGTWTHTAVARIVNREAVAQAA